MFKWEIAGYGEPAGLTITLTAAKSLSDRSGPPTEWSAR